VGVSSERHAGREAGLCEGSFSHKRAEDGKLQEYEGPLAQLEEARGSKCACAHLDGAESERHAGREVGLCEGSFSHKRAEDGKLQECGGPLAQLVRAEDS
jgi:hypothetical protein